VLCTGVHFRPFHCLLNLLHFLICRALGQPYSLASFGMQGGFVRLANVYGCEGWAYSFK